MLSLWEVALWLSVLVLEAMAVRPRVGFVVKEPALKVLGRDDGHFRSAKECLPKYTIEHMFLSTRMEKVIAGVG